MTLDMLNLISAGLGFIGTLILFKFGIPERIDTNGVIGFALLSKDKKEIQEIAKFKLLSNIGLFLIAISFLIQILLSVGISWKVVLSIHYSLNNSSENITGYNEPHHHFSNIERWDSQRKLNSTYSV